MTEQSDSSGIRIDKWLWAARFYKTRALASDAVKSGKITVNGDKIKASRTIRLGASIRIRREGYDTEVIVQGLSDKRGPATVAQQLYLETEQSRTAYEHWREQKRLLAIPAPQPGGRPTKRDRRQLGRIKRFNEL